VFTTVRINSSHVDHAEGDLDRLGIREPDDSDPAVIQHEGNSILILSLTFGF
jgi:hypothetical protein